MDKVREWWGKFRELPLMISLPTLVIVLALVALIGRGVVSAVARPDPTPTPSRGCGDLYDPRCDPAKFRDPDAGG